MRQTVSKSKFKPQALKYFRNIQETGQELVITDHGKPVLKISPFSEDSQSILEELRNSVTYYEDPLEPVGISDWEVLP